MQLGWRTACLESKMRPLPESGEQQVSIAAYSYRGDERSTVTFTESLGTRICAF